MDEVGVVSVNVDKNISCGYNNLDAKFGKSFGSLRYGPRKYELPLKNE